MREFDYNLACKNLDLRAQVYANGLYPSAALRQS